MSTLPRLFIDQDLVGGQVCPLPEAQAHYLTRVMRCGDGDLARAFNGRDGEWQAAIAVSGRQVSIKPIKQLRAQSNENVNLYLLFAPLKKTRTDFAVEKATELGAAIIQPITTERTQTQRVKTERLQALAIEAAEQTERMSVPAVKDLMTLDAQLTAWDRALPLIYCDEAGDGEGAPWGGSEGRAAPMASVIREFDSPEGGILIGPEGGFSPAERDRLRGLDFVHPVTLGPRILRAETAIVSALTIWQSVLGDWR